MCFVSKSTKLPITVCATQPQMRAEGYLSQAVDNSTSTKYLYTIRFSSNSEIAKPTAYDCWASICDTLMPVGLSSGLGIMTITVSAPSSNAFVKGVLCRSPPSIYQSSPTRMGVTRGAIDPEASAPFNTSSEPSFHQTLLPFVNDVAKTRSFVPEAFIRSRLTEKSSLSAPGLGRHTPPCRAKLMNIAMPSNNAKQALCSLLLMSGDSQIS
mmetsp:Transcript_61993/g.119485  ORF Transcript_61993/g.119485 Transcript_61993/m.119485 type:complete len:211 (+) Transcript_61993:533-1165(+)